MPFDIGDLFAKRRLVNVPYEGATLEVHYAPARFDAPTVMALGRFFTETERTGVPDLPAAASIAAHVIVDWNATEDGEPIPVTAAELETWDHGLLIDILLSLQNDYNAAKNGNSSSNGSPATGSSRKRRTGTPT